jgi:hypothetical protein
VLFRSLGDYDMMSVAFFLDIVDFFIGPVRQAYSNHPHRYSELPYGGPIGQMFGRLMRCYNARLAAIAKRRIAAGTYGLHNLDSRLFLPGFAPGPGSLPFLLRGLRKWMSVECKNFFLRSSSDSMPCIGRRASLAGS